MASSKASDASSTQSSRSTASRPKRRSIVSKSSASATASAVVLFLTCSVRTVSAATSTEQPATLNLASTICCPSPTCSETLATAPHVNDAERPTKFGEAASPTFLRFGNCSAARPAFTSIEQQQMYHDGYPRGNALS